MIWLLARRNIVNRPWRSALLLFGYGLGVAVMIVLLSVGEALLTQARDEKLVGGGQITVLPEGIDVEVMKTGGLGGLFFSIDHARFVQLQLLANPRLAGSVKAVAPQIDGKLVYLSVRGRQYNVRASGEIPSLSAAVSAPTPVASGSWQDDDDDRRWHSPTRGELVDAIDHFHLPPPGTPTAGSWAEWHYFNVLSPGGKRWAFITYMVAGNVPFGMWGGGLLVTVRDQGGETRRFGMGVPPAKVRFSLADADVRLGESSVVANDDGSYTIHGLARGEHGGRLKLDLVVTPEPRAYFPGATLRDGETVSGYAVAGLRATATGTLCIDAKCERYENAQSYKDHNWGSWRGVTWEWGAARAGSFGVLYGIVHTPESESDDAPLFLYLVDSLGFRALFRPRMISYEDGRIISVDGKRLRVPSRALLADVRGEDTVRLELDIEDAIATDTRRTFLTRGRDTRNPFFIQMKGRGTLSGRVGGVPIRGSGTGFFETYR